MYEVFVKLDGFPLARVRDHAYDDSPSYRAVTRVFNALPMAHVLNKRVFVVHGGLFEKAGGKVTLAELQKFNRFQQPEKGFAADMVFLC